MAINKNQIPIISEEGIKKALKAFKSVYKENKKQYEEENIKIEDVINLTKGFSGKSALLATTVIISIILFMPIKEFMAFMDTAKLISRVRLLEDIKEILKKEMVNKGADNDIDN